jgi:hypothetical protein
LIGSLQFDEQDRASILAELNRKKEKKDGKEEEEKQADIELLEEAGFPDVDGIQIQ